MQENTYAVNGVKLNVWEAGAEDGPVIIFLHGFPEAGFAWAEQMRYFSARGYRVLAPDQRGYNKSSKPQQIRAYRIEHLVQDIVLLIKAITRNKVVVVGHDWGGGVAWHLAMHHPYLLERLVIMNMPHPEIMRRTLKKNGRQRIKSSYAAFFQLPYLPEWVSRLFNFRMLEHTLKHTSVPGKFTDAKLAPYKEAWRQSGALTGMINWYRAYRFAEVKPALPIEVATLVIWGKKDAFLLPEMADASAALCSTAKLVIMKDATHWLHHEAPLAVARLIYEFIV